MSAEVLSQIMKDNEDLGMFLHMNSASVSLQKGQRMDGTKYGSLYDNGVAVIDLIGPIYPRANSMTTSGATSIAQFSNDVIRAYESNSVSAIVLNIDSPGGDVRGIADSADMIFDMAQKDKKPILSYGSGYMASAAYYVGSAAQSVTGNKHSVNGSIGVVMQARKNDKDMIEITSSQSPNKRLDPTTDEGVAKIRQRLDDIAEIFIGDVARYRGISAEKVLAKYGQGDVFVGPRAKKQGLIDKIGTLSSVVEEAAKLSGTGRRNVSRPIRQSYEAIEEGAEALTLLKFTEEDTMGLKELAVKFGIGTEKAPDATLDATEESVDPATASEGDEGTTEGTTEEGQEGNTLAALPTREEVMESFEAHAENFALTLLMENKIYPAQQAAVAGAMLNAKTDDKLFAGTVQFVNADGEVAEGTREDMMRAMFASMPKHSMTQQAIKGIKEGSVVASVLKEADPDTEKDGPMSAERRAQLLGTTELGQRVLSRTK